jgi:hypothetical protein
MPRLSRAEEHRRQAVELLASSLKQAGEPNPLLKASRIVDHVSAHAVETVMDLLRAEEGKTPRR